MRSVIFLLLITSAYTSFAYDSGIAVQSENLGKSKFLDEHIFSNLNLDNLGNVTFNLFASIKPELVSYKETLARDAGLETQ